MVTVYLKVEAFHFESATIRITWLIYRHVRVTYRLWANQRVDIKGQEQAVQEVVSQNVVEEFTVDNENIIQVVEVVQMLCYQVT